MFFSYCNGIRSIKLKELDQVGHNVLAKQHSDIRTAFWCLTTKCWPRWWWTMSFELSPGNGFSLTTSARIRGRACVYTLDPSARCKSRRCLQEDLPHISALHKKATFYPGLRCLRPGHWIRVRTAFFWHVIIALASWKTSNEIGSSYQKGDVHVYTNRLMACCTLLCKSDRCSISLSGPFSRSVWAFPYFHGHAYFTRFEYQQRLT